MNYRIEYQRSTTYVVTIEDVDNPEAALDEFWNMDDDGDLADVEIEVDGSGPYGLAMYDNNDTTGIDLIEGKRP